MMLHKIATPLAQCGLKFESSEGQAQFSGYASVFGGVDSDNDTIHPGAFQKSLAENGIRAVKMFVNHDQFAVPVGGYQDAKEDDTGLWVAGEINMEHKDGPTVYSALKRGDVDGFSIGFGMQPGDWQAKEGFEDDHFATIFGNREIYNVELREISVVNYPADAAARIADVKSVIKDFDSPKDFERYLRVIHGFSAKSATAFVAQLKRVCMGEPCPAEETRDNTSDVKDVLSSIRRELRHK